MTSGRKPVMNIRLWKKGKATRIVDWTCPKCYHRNSQLWFGRGYHFCTACYESTDLKGATV